jgi:predicted AlkP superfamily phosphohydrolase/phosphomutase
MPGQAKKKSNRVCVIGLDGVPYGLIRDLAEKGILSTLGRIIDSGRLHKMKASLPEISAVSWTDFMTGADSGSHGIFGFTDIKPGTYDLRFPNFLDVKVPTFWDTLGERGKTCIVINQPSTYPARPLANGTVISGFVAVEMAKSVHPLSNLAVLEQMGYQIDIDTLRAKGNNAVLWNELIKTLMGRQKAFNHFWEERWDYFELVLTGTDRLHHFLWKAVVDPDHPHHQNVLEYYRQIDRLINKIYTSFRKTAGDEENIFFLSDHGFTAIEQEVYLNAWLEKEKFLRFTTPSPQGLGDIHGKTVAFALDPNRIYLHYKDRYPRGTVYRRDGKAIRETIARRLEKLTFEGRKVVRKVFLAKDVYSGPLISKGPDLIVLGEPGFDMKGSLRKKEIFGRTPGLQGMHTWDDAFFLSKRDFGEDLAISQISDIILERF